MTATCRAKSATISRDTTDLPAACLSDFEIDHFVMAITAIEAMRWHSALGLGAAGVRSTAVNSFVRRENIKRYRNLLREVNDEAGRRLIRKLLLEEEQKEVPFQTPSPPTARSRYLWR
jgi:hypothetical protein